MSRAWILLALFTATSAARAEAIPKWTIACEQANKDQFGEKKRRHCSLLVFNNQRTGSLVMDDGRTFVMNSRVVVEIDSAGTRLVKAPKGNYCKKGGVRAAVDGKRIDSLPPDRQLAAMKEGQIFVWEEQADWPQCQNLAPHGTSLAGFKEALGQFQDQFGKP